jgi:hypothetical protein
LHRAAIHGEADKINDQSRTYGERYYINQRSSGMCGQCGNADGDSFGQLQRMLVLNAGLRQQLAVVQR